MRRAFLPACALLLAACAQQPPAAPPASPPPPPASACNADAAQYAVGRPQTAPLVEEIRQRTGAHIARILRPNQVVTMEFNAERVNVVVDAENRITAVRCG
ncbi:starvation-inducible protein [Ramlibacter sp. USB13]|uniref:Starvation-inducible protein n=2 Tax=Ramlibacter cellulosilyticus TaxID=2764187 RepID=A0A923MT82_9BURK|nr:starvation-inducible protein [Ramlibacter cellulosilyticus]